MKINRQYTLLFACGLSLLALLVVVPSAALILGLVIGASAGIFRDRVRNTSSDLVASHSTRAAAGRASSRRMVFSDPTGDEHSEVAYRS